MAAAAAPSRARKRPAHAKTRRRSGAPAARRPAARKARGRRVRVDGMLRGRQWIVLVGILLAGIVFLNVALLELNSAIAGSDQRAGELKRENAAIRGRVARLGSTERIQQAAADLGLVLPEAGNVRYLRAEPRLDARRAAQRITEPTPVAEVPAPATTTTPPELAAPGTVAPTPTATPVPAAAPVTPQAAPQPTAAPPTQAPQATPVTQAPSAGGVPAG